MNKRCDHVFLSFGRAPRRTYLLIEMRFPKVSISFSPNCQKSDNLHFPARNTLSISTYDVLLARVLGDFDAPPKSDISLILVVSLLISAH